MISYCFWLIVWCNDASLCSFPQLYALKCGALVMGFLAVDSSSFSGNFHFFSEI